MNEVINRVANSTLVSIDLDDFYTPGERTLIDLKENLFQGLILREKDFRGFIKTHDWKSYSNKHVAITCSTDAIIPFWAYMLVTSVLQPFAKTIFVGNLLQLENHLFHNALQAHNWSQYQNAKVVIKGCSKVQVPPAAFAEATSLLRPVASSIMYGEPCSTVPIFKKTLQPE